MAKISNIRGMLLEEALLHLLRGTGYKTVESVGVDPTLSRGPGGLVVKGRGGDHQIDAIADFMIQAPFTHPQRLLVEAKCYSIPIGIGKLREAVGVLKDVSEYWVTRSGIPRSRFHYNYAYFSASGYSSEAERYAFAQDIYLIPLTKSKFLKPIITSVKDIGNSDFGVGRGQSEIDIDLTEFRKSVRASLKNGRLNYNDDIYRYEIIASKLKTFIGRTRRINYAMIAVIEGGLQLFMVPSQGVALNNLPSYNEVRIYWDDNSWYIRDKNERNLFSFDLPVELFQLYAEEGTLRRESAITLKEENLSEFTATYFKNDQLKTISFKLDHNWIDDIKRRINASK